MHVRYESDESRKLRFDESVIDERGTRLRDDDDDGMEKAVDDAVRALENCVGDRLVWKWKALHPFINRTNDEATKDTLGPIMAGDCVVGKELGKRYQSEETKPECFGVIISILISTSYARRSMICAYQYMYSSV